MQKKHFIASLLVLCTLLSFTGCSGKKDNYQRVYNVDKTDMSREQTYLDELKKIKPEGNAIYSPTSTRTALQMTSYITTNDKVISDINVIIGNTDFMSYKSTKATKFVNRVWVNKKVDIKIPSELNDYIYKMDMSDSAKATKEKDDFVKDNTNGFLDGTPSILGEETKYDVMNITYFKDIWAKEGGYRLESFNPLLFNNPDGTKKEVDTFYASVDDAFENDTCFLVSLDYKNGNIFNLIYPKDNINDVNLANLKKMNIDWAELYIPEFETRNEFDLTSYFPVDMDSALTQITRIKVDHEGTEAVAVTENNNGTGFEISEEEVKILTLRFDVPFYYYIEDTRNNDIIFVGRVVSFE